MRRVLLLLGAVCVAGCQTQFDSTLLRAQELPARYEIHDGNHGFLRGWVDFTAIESVSTADLNGHEITIVRHPMHWEEGDGPYSSGGPTKRLSFSRPYLTRDSCPFSLWYGRTLLTYRYCEEGLWALVGDDPETAVVASIVDYIKAGGPIEVSVCTVGKLRHADGTSHPAQGLVWLDNECQGRNYVCNVSSERYENCPKEIKFIEVGDRSQKETRTLRLDLESGWGYGWNLGDP